MIPNVGWEEVAAPALPAKRAVDVVGALLLGALLLPLMLLIAAAVRLDSPGPALFVQERRGRGLRVIRVYKFRTLRHGAEERQVRSGADARVTRVGRVLRRTGLDELPQLLNVLAGSMSLVGPRPLLDRDAVAYLPSHRERFAVKPGLTGLAEVRGRNRLSPEARGALDVAYVRGWSVWLDLRVLLRTPLVLLTGDGVYPDP